MFVIVTIVIVKVVTVVILTEVTVVKVTVVIVTEVIFTSISKNNLTPQHQCDVFRAAFCNLAMFIIGGLWESKTTKDRLP